MLIVKSFPYCESMKDSTGPGLRLLPVEDDRLDVLIFRRQTLSYLPGVSLEVAGSIRELRELVPAFKPDVILLDLGLPDSNGLDDLPELIREFSGIPFVILSGMTERDAIEGS